MLTYADVCCSGTALERIGQSVMQYVIISDTIPLRHDYAPGSFAEKVRPNTLLL
jgi:phosphoribosylpyrophosphate synthetase